jgi:hypothetical protein
MHKWSRNALACIFLLIAIAITVPVIVHMHARAAFHAAGLNEGRIQQRQEIAAIIEKAVLVSNCRSTSTDTTPIELLTVKAQPLYLVPIDRNIVAFCK